MTAIAPRPVMAVRRIIGILMLVATFAVGGIWLDAPQARADLNCDFYSHYHYHWTHFDYYHSHGITGRRNGYDEWHVHQHEDYAYKYCGR